VPGKAAVPLIVQEKLFFARFPQDANGFFFLPVQLQVAFNPEALAAMLYIGSIGPAEITFCKAEIMDGVQQVGFTGPVAAANANDSLCKPVLRKIVVLELED
jgi:hypothetical protein